MSSSKIERMLVFKNLVSTMLNFGILSVNEHIFYHLLKLNPRYILPIFEEANSLARLANKNNIYMNDIRKAILKITGEDVFIPDRQLVNKEYFNTVILPFESTTKVDFPDLNGVDIEETIRSIRDDANTTTNNFDVDSLLNDPYSL